MEWDSREKILATGGHDGQVRLWNPATGQPYGAPLWVIPNGLQRWLSSLSISSPRVRLGPVLRLLQKTALSEFEYVYQKAEFVLTGHAASVNCLRWGGENVIYTGSSDRTVKIWSGVDVSRRIVIAGIK